MTRRELYDAIAELPTTNTALLLSYGIATVYVAVVLTGIVVGRITDANIGPLEELGEIILFILGIGTAQYASKRFSYKQQGVPPQPDREDTPALEDER